MVSALLHNNCYYFAHELLTLGSVFKAKKPISLKNHVITFVDLIDSLRSLGRTVLRNQLDIQKKQIIDRLRDSGML